MQQWRRASSWVSGNRSSAALGAVMTSLLLVASLVAYQRPARSEWEPRLNDGAMWVRSTGVGLVSLLDGSRGDVVTTFRVAQAEDDIEVRPDGSDLLILNRTDQTLSRLNGSTWEKTPPLGIDAVPVDVLTGNGAGWLVRPGFVDRIDPASLTASTSIAVGSSFRSGLVTTDGSLFYASEDADEPPVHLTIVDGEGTSTAIDGLDGPVEFVQLDTGVAAVDLDDGRVWREGAGIVCEDLRLSTTAIASGSHRHLIVASGDGAAMFWDPAESGCPTTATTYDIGAGRYDSVAVAENWGVVADADSGGLWLLDTNHAPSPVFPDVVGENGFEVAAENNTIWFNDPRSNLAGLVQRDGQVFSAEKYVQGSESGIPTPPVADTPEPPELGTQRVTTTSSATSTTVSSGEAASTTTADSSQVTTSTTGASPISEATTTSSPATGSPATETTSLVTIPDSSEAATATSSSTTTPAPSTTTPTNPDSTSTTSTTSAPAAPTVAIATDIASPTVGEEVRYAAQTRSGSPVDWAWSVVPDEGTRRGSDSDFFYTFTQPGRHTVRVDVCDAAKRCSFATRSVTVLAEAEQAELVASFTGASATIEIDETATFRSTSQGEPDELEWTFEDGSPSSGSGSTASARWSAPGTYRVTLRASRDGQSDVRQGTVTVLGVQPEPSLGLTCSPGVLEAGQSSNCSLQGDAQNFTNISLSTSPSGPAIGSAGGDGSFTVRSESAGTFTVTLTARNGSNGDNRSASTTLVFDDAVAAPPPQVRIDGPSSTIVGETINLSGSIVSGTVSSWSWTADGASPGSGSQQAMSFSWAAAGTYTVRLTGSGAEGDHTDAHTVTVSQPVDPAPEVSIQASKTTVDPGESVTLTGVVNSGSVSNWSWNTGGGSPASGSQQNITASWSSPGSYTVAVEASGPGGRDTASVTIEVADTSHDHSITVTGVSTEEDRFTINVQVAECATLTWSIPAVGVGPYTESSCLTAHTLSPRTNVSLNPSTTYTISATFTFHGVAVPWSTSVTTEAAQATNPIVSTSYAYSGANVTVTMSSDVCTTLSNAWFSTTDGGTLGIGEHKGDFASGDCLTSRTYTFTRQADQGFGGGTYRPYRVHVTYQAPGGGADSTTANIPQH